VMCIVYSKYKKSGNTEDHEVETFPYLITIRPLWLWQQHDIDYDVESTSMANGVNGIYDVDSTS